MTLLRCPKFLRCLTADAGNFDRGHSLASLHLPLAALGSLPTSARPEFFPHLRQGTRALPYKVLRYRGRADRVVRPYKPFRRAGCPHPAARTCTALLAKTLSLRTSDRCHWLWQSVFFGFCARVLRMTLLRCPKFLRCLTANA